MGLDISVYPHLKFVKPRSEATDCDWDEYIFAHVDEDFATRADGMRPGFYERNRSLHRFRAGSYSGYNYWRARLSRVILGVEPEAIWNNRDEYRDKPFYELIDFSDCEGIIGPQTSAKLAGDFIAYENDFVASEDTDTVDIERYCSWKRAFELAAESNGHVQFG